MAYVYPHQRRTVPAPFFYDLRPATPPIVPVAVINPYFLQSVPHQIEFVVPNPPVLRPFGFTLNHAAIIQMDEQRTQALIQFISKEGLVPSPEEESKRKNAIDQLKQTVQLWVKKVAWQRRLPKSHIYCASATILTYGSYGLGVHGSDSDIDALCIGPFYASIVDDFFIVLRNMLSSRPEVTELHCVKNAKVPLMRFKFNGISVDLPYAQLPIISVPDNLDILNPALLDGIDETSRRSLSGVLANTHILHLVQNLENFQALLRCIKLWARRRGIYNHLHGFFGGIHLVILAAHVCQRCPNASLSSLMLNFFGRFSSWPWPKPVILQTGSSFVCEYPDGRALMPIMMPCPPYDWCNSNITNSTFVKIKAEFSRGYDVMRNIGKLNFEWTSLFEPFPYSTSYTHFVRILLAAPDSDELLDWRGWVKSRFLGLLLKLEEVQGFCDPNPTEYVDHKEPLPNTVFYWGLSSIKSRFIDIRSVREDFMRSVENGYQGSSGCRLELSVIESSQLPKDAQSEAGIGKGSRAFWRNPDYNDRRKPIYSQHLPGYFVGYIADDQDGYPTSAG